MTRSFLQLIAINLLIVLAIPSHSQTGTSPDFQSWARMVERAESVIETAAASNSALAVLRTDLANWRQEFTANQLPLKIQIDQLNARLKALGEPIEGEAEDSQLAILRDEVRAKLLEKEKPFRIAEDAIQTATGLIRQINSIENERIRLARATRGPTPFNPVNWLTVFGLTGEYFSALVKALDASWDELAIRQQFLQSLPLALMWLILGGFSLSLARRYVYRWAGGFSKKHEGLSGRGGGFSALLADVVLPAVGIAMIVESADSIRLINYFNEDLVNGAALAGLMVFFARWLAKALFSSNGLELVSSRLGSDWSLSAKRSVIWLGWAVALHSVIKGLQFNTDASPAYTVMMGFPALLVVAILVFQLSRRLSEHLAALAKSDDQRPFSDTVLSGIMIIARAAVVIGVVLAVIGYGVAGDYLVFPVVYSLALLGAFFALEAIITGLISELAARGVFLATRIKIGLVRVLVGLVLFLLALPIVALAWGATVPDIVGAWQLAREGLPIGSQRVTITDVVRFVVIFAAGAVLTALIQSILQRSVLPNTELSSGAQRALITGLGYVGVTLAGIAAVSMTHFDFTNLAIVAGALSVGIGFGLQTIVSNFVSGIILLVERPINVGDWVEVGGVSGFVRNVSVRSTHIETFDRARVILPNSDLIAGKVTNWTLDNRRGRIILPVGVAYDSDTHRVQDILMEIADQHPAVLREPPPSAVFMRFGADALEFELRVILGDVNHILSARSELNFAIAERFQKEGISIPFPQRDLWLRNSSEEFFGKSLERQEKDQKE